MNESKQNQVPLSHRMDLPCLNTTVLTFTSVLPVRQVPEISLLFADLIFDCKTPSFSRCALALLTYIGVTFSRQVSKRGGGGWGGSMIAQGQGGESQRTIFSRWILPVSFLTSPYLLRSPLVKGRLCWSLQPEMENPFNKPGPEVTK